MEKKFPVDAKDYKLFEEIGEGVSATVYRALCIPLNNVVAIKILDLEKCNNDLDGIRREVQTMSLIDHPNVLCAHCSFTTGHQLWVVMPFMSGGSFLHIMKSVYPEGLEEPVIATLLREVLKALVYLHSQGHIHRDVKAGNILIDGDGTVKLADFGVTACMFDTGDRQRSRNTFVGTPCWMAPEVMQPVHGYDFKADIWSLGITALELAHGHAPFSKYPPMKVLLMTLQNAPPGLDYERDRRFSKSFKDIVGACLVKDSKKRPSAEKLLKHHFFKSARSSEYLARTILDGLPPLGDRTMALKAKEADILVQNRSLSEDKEHLSQQEYIRGISAWNFDPEELKHQAALVSDADDVSSVEDQGLSEKPRGEHNDAGSSAERMSSESSSDHMQDGVISVHELDNSLAAFPITPLQALKGCFDVGEDDVDAGSPLLKEAYLSNSEQLSRIPDSETAIGIGAIREDGESAGPDSLLARFANTSHKKLLGGIITPDAVISPKRFTDGDWEHLQPKYQTERNHSGPLQHCPKREMIIPSTGDDTSDGAFVQRKGRFKVTSADISPKIPANNVFNTLWGGGSTSPATSGNPAAPFLTSLQCILQQNTLQREELLKLIKYIEHSSGPMESADSFNDLLQISSTSSRERELQSQVIQLQNSVEHLAEELQRQKLKNVQLEKKLNTLLKRDE